MCPPPVQSRVKSSGIKDWNILVMSIGLLTHWQDQTTATFTDKSPFISIWILYYSWNFEKYSKVKIDTEIDTCQLFEIRNKSAGNVGKQRSAIWIWFSLCFITHNSTSNLVLFINFFRFKLEESVLLFDSMFEVLFYKFSLDLLGINIYSVKKSLYLLHFKLSEALN